MDELQNKSQQNVVFPYFIYFYSLGEVSHGGLVDVKLCGLARRGGRAV